MLCRHLFALLQYCLLIAMSILQCKTRQGCSLTVKLSEHEKNYQLDFRLF